jgi:hypothetical protein
MKEARGRRELYSIQTPAPGHITCSLSYETTYTGGHWRHLGVSEDADGGINVIIFSSEEAHRVNEASLGEESDT